MQPEPPQPDELDDLVITEGDEEVQYVLVEFGANIDSKESQGGSTLNVQGLETDQPTLVLNSGDKLQGSYQDTLGTVMLFKQSTNEQGEVKCDYLGMAEQSIVFKR